LANPKTSLKSLRVSNRRRAYNKPVRSSIKTFTAKAADAILAKDPEASRAAAVEAVSMIDRAASKGVIHPNQAARRKSRLMKKLNQALGG
jgi:small subunit ribosomal protein S20